MEWIFPLILGGAALAYITMPFWAGASAVRRAARETHWHSASQLELDRDLGKIDEAEYEELAPATEPEPVRWPLSSLEALIFRARRQKRLDVALESEVLIARARTKK